MRIPRLAFLIATLTNLRLFGKVCIILYMHTNIYGKLVFQFVDLCFRYIFIENNYVSGIVVLIYYLNKLLVLH